MRSHYLVRLLFPTLMLCIAGCSEAEEPTTCSPADSRTHRIQWSGYYWTVKEATQYRVGPGENFFSPELVWVDSDDRLHLKIARRNGVWHCSEIALDTTLGYGRYIFHTDSRIDLIPPAATLGLFTYSHNPEAHHRENDIEYSRWMNPNDPCNGQFCVQPYDQEGRLHRFSLDLGSTTYSTHMFEWREDRIDFACLLGHTRDPDDNGKVAYWQFRGDVPTPLDERCRINLWLCGGVPSGSVDEVEVILSSFEHIR